MLAYFVERSDNKKHQIPLQVAVEMPVLKRALPLQACHALHLYELFILFVKIRSAIFRFFEILLKLSKKAITSAFQKSPTEKDQ
ncbi:unnamed protein product [Larinioides sclopetarius]|uniref:Uncharacterized protein n=1 Tax=Larinioides sclopetarius TaxID=280406 RepID=A0AAV1Z2Y1_9ARAC